MRTPDRRHVLMAAATVAFGVLPAATAAGTAHATTVEIPCYSVLSPTPSAEVDLEGDGNADVRVPSISNVSVCGWGDLIARGPGGHVGMCRYDGSLCWQILIPVEAGASLEGEVRVCRSIDGAYSCSIIEQERWSVATPTTRTLCIGIDQNGGGRYPCGDGTSPIAFE